MSKKNRQQQGINVLNRLDPSTLANLYMQNVNRYPHLHPGVTRGDAQVDDIASDFVSWCSGFTVGVQQSGQQLGQSGQFFNIGGQQTGSPQGRTLTFPGQQQGQQQQSRRQQGSSQSVNVNSLPTPIQNALQTIINNYSSSGTGRQRQRMVS